MNRTGIFLAAAAVLALVALVAGLPRSGGGSATTVIATPRPPDPVRPPPALPGSLTLTTRLSHPVVGTGAQDVFVTADLRAVDVPGQTRVPVNLALVIDRSGSMSGFKLNQAKLAARQLIGELRDEDRLAVVHFGSDVKSMDGLVATEANKARLLAYVDSIWDDGGTNIGQALAVGRDLVLKAQSKFLVNRLVLVSDGQPTEGVVDFGALIQEVRETRSHGISVSAIGVGTDFNEQLMEAFAETGGGAYAYLQDATQLAGIFKKDLAAAGTQVARGVVLTFRAPGKSGIAEALGYPTISRADGADAITIAMPDMAAGQTERVVVRLTVPGGAPGDRLELVDVRLAYEDVLAHQNAGATASLSAQVSASEAEVAQGRDKDAILFSARARSAANTQAAAEALKGGDREKAEQLLQQNRFFFDEAGAVAGPEAIADDLRGQAEMKQRLDAAKDPDGISGWGKEARKKARMDFGLIGNTY